MRCLKENCQLECPLLLLISSLSKVLQCILVDDYHICIWNLCGIGTGTTVGFRDYFSQYALVHSQISFLFFTLDMYVIK